MTEEMRHLMEGLDRIYSAPYLFGKTIPPVRPVLDSLALLPDDIVVELGTGNGHFTLPIAQHLEKHQGRGVIFGCDFSKPLVDTMDQQAIASGVDRHLRAICLDDIQSHTLPLDDASVDTALAVNVIQYLTDPLPYLEEITRVLAPCGELLIADWRDPATVENQDDAKMGFEVDQMSALLNTAGLVLSHQLELPGYSWAIESVKPIVFNI